MTTVGKLTLDGLIPVNCYFLERDGKCFVVDPGYRKQAILDYLAQNGLDPVGILLTHAHVDHIGALDCCDVPVYLHASDYDLLFDDDRNGFDRYGLRKTYRPENLEVIPVEDGANLPLGNGLVSVIHTPGHTGGSVCYRMDEHLLTGDTLFAGGVGRWDRPTASLEQLQASLLDIIENHDDAIRIFPGHGESSTIGREREGNPFYHAWKRP